MEQEITNSDLKLINYQLIEMNKKIEVINTKLDNNDARYSSKEELKALSDRTAALEDTNKWLVRIIIGAVILAVLGTIIITKT